MCLARTFGWLALLASLGLFGCRKAPGAGPTPTEEVKKDPVDAAPDAASEEVALADLGFAERPAPLTQAAIDANQKGLDLHRKEKSGDARTLFAQSAAA